MHKLIFVNTKTAFFGAVLLLGNMTLVAEAKAIEYTYNVYVSTAEDIGYNRIGTLLEEKGLDKEAAQAKVQKLFGGNSVDLNVALWNLKHTMGTELSNTELEAALVKRALFEKPVNFDSYDSIVGLMQEIKGTALDAQTLNKLKSVATLNGSLVG